MEAADMSTSTKPKWTIAGMSLALTLGACSSGGESDPTEGLPPEIGRAHV